MASTLGSTEAWRMNSSTERGERRVGVVHQHVALAELAEEVDLLVVVAGQAGLGDRHPHRVLQVGPVDAVHRPQPAEVDRPDVRGRRRRRRRRARAASSSRISSDIVVVDLEAHGPAEAAAAQLDLDRGEQVVGLLLLEGEVGVAGDPEGEVALDLHAGEERVEVGGDDLLERHEPLAVGHHHEPGQQQRHLHPGEAALAG